MKFYYKTAPSADGNINLYAMLHIEREMDTQSHVYGTLDGRPKTTHYLFQSGPLEKQVRDLLFRYIDKVNFRPPLDGANQDRAVGHSQAEQYHWYKEEGIASFQFQKILDELADIKTTDGKGDEKPAVEIEELDELTGMLLGFLFQTPGSYICHRTKTKVKPQ